MTDVDDWRDYDDYEPSEPDWDYIEEQRRAVEHSDKRHAGGPCDCPEPAAAVTGAPTACSGGPREIVMPDGRSAWSFAIAPAPVAAEVPSDAR